MEYINKEFKWFKIIDKKEHNGQIEAFHLIVEKDCFDSKERLDLKNSKKSRKERIQEIKEKPCK